MAKKTIKGFHDGSIILKTSNNTYTIAEHALVTSDYIGGGVLAGVLGDDITAMPTPKNNTFIVNGQIVGAVAGVLAQGAGDTVNIGLTGRINASYAVGAVGTGIHVTNAGQIISASGYAIYGTADDLNVRNNGVINAMAGIVAEGNHAVLVNGVKGDMHIGEIGIAADTDAGETSTIINHGHIMVTTTSSDAILGGDGNDSVTNDGNIIGNVDMGDGNDKIDDRGGKVAGTISGGNGNDVLTTDHSSDVLYEETGKGIDTVRSTVSYTLSSNVEKLTLIGKANINGTGLDGTAETLFGNDGNNTLRGLGGADQLYGGKGQDILVGGAGADVFHFSTGYGNDRISDFVHLEDKLDLSGWGTMTSLAEVKDHAVDKGADLLITLGSDSLLVRHIHEADLTDADFVYALG